MNIILLDLDKSMCNEWTKVFKGKEDIYIVNDNLEHFLSNNQVDCIVSPANSFGIMDGGYDLAITNWFGRDLMHKVQDMIINEFYGEQPVSSSIIIETESNPKYLIHTPTMRYPMIVKDYEVIYHCMRNTLMKAIENNINTIVIPAFGRATGRVPNEIVAYMMYRGYISIKKPNNHINWSVVIPLL